MDDDDKDVLTGINDDRGMAELLNKFFLHQSLLQKIKIAFLKLKKTCFLEMIMRNYALSE